MCSHCGTFWSKNPPQVRVIPGKHPSKSVNKIIKSSSRGNKISKFCATLMKKSLKNKMNKIIMKCSVCSKNTQISCQKPEKLKVVKDEPMDVSFQKKKKKRRKDKTAGLNISFLSTPKVEDKKQKDTSIVATPSTVKIKKSKNLESTPSNQKSKKLNPSKLASVLNNDKNKKSRNSLSNFLKELY